MTTYALSFTYNGTAYGYEELFEESGKEHFNLMPKSQSSACTRTFILDWENRFFFINYMYYAQHPSVGWTYATEFINEGYGIATGVNTWVQCKVTVNYHNFPFQTSSLIDVSCDISSEMLTIPKESYTLDYSAYQSGSGYAPSTSALSKDIQLKVSFANYTVNKHNQSSIPESTYLPLINCVNSAALAVTGSTYQWQPNSLLYLGYSFSVKYSTGSLPVYEITHKLIGSITIGDHRKEWNPTTGNFALAQAKGSGSYKYQSADLTVLFS